ncbi:MAG: hypothetical protein R2710_17055 [Acidimicrobiales bacterium]
MLLELGPLAADDVQHWIRFARRMMCEFRVDPCDLEGVATRDFLEQWQSLIDAWERHATTTGPTFRWSSHLDIELAEYLLHGLERCVRSDAIQALTTTKEQVTHAAFTFHVMQAFVDGLSGQGGCHEHLIDQIRASVGARLDH